MSADSFVFRAALVCLVFLLGMDVGNWRARDQIAVTCLPQPGESLVATHVLPSGILLCEYSRSFAGAIKTRKAST